MHFLVSVSTTIPGSSCVYNLRETSEFFLHGSPGKANQENPRFGCGLKAVLLNLFLWLNLPLGGVITEEPFLSVFPETRNPSTLGIVIAAFELGAFVGALSCLDLGDRLGRRSTVFLGMAFMVIGGTLQTSAWHVAQLTVGRVISGIGLGLQVATVPSW